MMPRPSTDTHRDAPSAPGRREAPERGLDPLPDRRHPVDAGVPLRVLLVEDSQLLAQRIAELVNDLPNVVLAGTVGSEADAVTRLERGDIDAVILDLQLHTGSGFGVLRALRRRASPPSVIVFTNFSIGAYRDTAFALGAEHFLDKSRDYDQLPHVLQQLSDSLH